MRFDRCLCDSKWLVQPSAKLFVQLVGAGAQQLRVPVSPEPLQRSCMVAPLCRERLKGLDIH